MLCAGAPFVLDLGPHKWIATMSLILVTVLNTVALGWFQRRGLLRPIVIACADYAVAAVVGLAVPVAFQWALMALLPNAVIITIGSHQRRTFQVIAGVAPVLFLVGALGGAPNWKPSFYLFIAMSLCSAWIVGEVAAREVELRSRYRSVAHALNQQANHDVLTSLPNRAHFQRRLAEEIALAHMEQRCVSVLLMDLNQFKDVNDSLGHHHGDLLLIELAQRLDAVVSPDHFAARLGGDEFAVIARCSSDAHEAVELARIIAEAFSKPARVDDVTLQSSASIGISVFPRDAVDAQTLVQRADSAMYRAKSSGTGVALHTQEQQHSSSRRLRLLNDLPSAISSGELRMEYQPRFDLTTNEIVGVEALVRWQHREFGLLYPDQFIELAEVSGNIQELTHEIIRIAINDLSFLSQQGMDLEVSINLSVRNLYDPLLLDIVQECLDTQRFPAQRVMFEITESELMEDPRVALEVLNAIRGLGAEISIDDFGTGYSSMAYLRDLPISEIKIDRSFVAGIESGDDLLVRTIIELGHNLNMSVVAEGIETAEQLAAITALGCDGAQGYFLSRPLGFDQLCQRLESQRTRPPDTLPRPAPNTTTPAATSR